MAQLPKKFFIINDALRATANNLASEVDLTAAEGAASLEWERASAAYDRELPILLERHPWPFAKATEPLDKAHEDENPSPRWAAAYDWPYACLWLQRIDTAGGTPLDYEIVGQYLCMNYAGEDGDAPIATFIQTPQPSEASNLFYEILRVRVEVACLRGINEDYSEAKRREDYCERELFPMIRNRTDQQQSPRRAFRSTMRERRSGGGPSPLRP